MSITADDQASTRDRILDAALTAFADRGVEATSLDAVAAAVGVRKQTLLYWFPSKEQLLFGVVDHAVGEVSAELSVAAQAAISRQPRPGPDPGPLPMTRALVAVVDATFRIGAFRPELLAVVREVARLGPPASTHLASAIQPLVDVAVVAIGSASHDRLARAGAAGPGRNDVDPERVRRVLLAAGAQVVGMVTDAEVRADLGLPADLAWLRARRRSLLEALSAELAR